MATLGEQVSSGEDLRDRRERVQEPRAPLQAFPLFPPAGGLLFLSVAFELVPPGSQLPDHPAADVFSGHAPIHPLRASVVRSATLSFLPSHKHNLRYKVGVFQFPNTTLPRAPLSLFTTRPSSRYRCYHRLMLLLKSRNLGTFVLFVWWLLRFGLYFLSCPILAHTYRFRCVLKLYPP